MAAIEEAKGRDGPDFSALPEGCIATVVSLTSPADTSMLATLSPDFKSACDSDVVWASFLPAGAPQTVSRSSYSLDRHSGKKCIMLSARALSITWGDTPIYWSWTCLPNSRFAEVAKLIDVCWLEIRGMISSGMLSPETHYAAYLVFKITPASHGFEFQPVEVEARFAGDEAGKSWRRFRHAGGSLMLAPAEGSGNYPKERRDGWSEIELGEFLTKEGQDGEVEMSVMETKGGNWKAELVVEGIEIRPKDGK
ncbi:hypothetical protein EUGRSUZ_L01377 [Eucalyptus grandis]|uniref:F-box domain-containing protein n=1 Tax=Eucalyptus grandis TaxID=71139 RepID=A0A058ZVH5_EUCGR|nr:hypothetical protein EUGRSUZ_L01377 [Eucalyptus grandis]